MLVSVLLLKKNPFFQERYHFAGGPFSGTGTNTGTEFEYRVPQNLKMRVPVPLCAKVQNE